MTPCEEEGYKVGDEFVVTEKTTFQKGDRVRLIEDDGTNCPAFKGVGCKAEDGTDWNYIHLRLVRKVDNDDSIITRTNGQPFATEASGRQQLTAKGLQGTHEVVPHEGGYALALKRAPKQDDEPITLQPGDHVFTEGMTEEQYHAVARAFENAGCPRFCPEDGKGRGEILEWYDGALFSCITPEDGGRHLTIDQVLGATNAGNATPKPEQPTIATTQLGTIADPITTLKKARQARDEAEAAYQAALEVMRNELPGYVLTEVGNDAQQVDGEDMTDPANWRKGDVLVCISTDKDHQNDFEYGHTYTVSEAVDDDGWISCKVEHGRNNLPADHFRFHHRPA